MSARSEEKRDEDAEMSSVNSKNSNRKSEETETTIDTEKSTKQHTLLKDVIRYAESKGATVNSSVDGDNFIRDIRIEYNEAQNVSIDENVNNELVEENANAEENPSDTVFKAKEADYVNRNKLIDSRVSGLIGKMIASDEKREYYEDSEKDITEVKSQRTENDKDVENMKVDEKTEELIMTKRSEMLVNMCKS